MKFVLNKFYYSRFNGGQCNKICLRRMSPKNTLLLDGESQVALARCFRELRIAIDPPMTQKQAALDLKIPQSTLCQVEKGNQEPSLELIRSAARLYQVHPNTILGVIYMHEFYMKALDPEGYMQAEAAGAVGVQDALTPEQRQAARERLRRLGYEKIP